MFPCGWHIPEKQNKIKYPLQNKNKTKTKKHENSRKKMKKAK